MKAVLKTGAGAGAFLLASAMLCGTASAGAGPPPTYCPTAVPEIDPGAAVGAMTLLVGGLFTLADKRRARCVASA